MRPVSLRDMLRHSATAMAAALVFVGGPTVAWALDPGDSAIPFQLVEIGSENRVSLSEFAGRAVFVDFWASWCGPCRQSMPAYEAMNERLSGEAFTLLAINLDEDPENAKRFLDSHPVSYTVLLDPGGGTAEKWSIPAMPSSFLVAPDQRIVRAWAGFKDSHSEEVEREIRSLLAQ